MDSREVPASVATPGAGPSKRRRSPARRRDAGWPAGLAADDNRQVGDPSAGSSDDALLAAARAGSADALDLLVARYEPRVLRFSVRMCRDLEDARDVAQETLLAMARAVGSFRGDAALSTWLYAIARRICIRKRRRRSSAARMESLAALEPEQLGRLRDPAPDPERSASARELQAALDAAIAALQPAQREVLLLRDVEGLTATEVARVLGLGVEAVKSRLHRARLAVRSRLAPLLARPRAVSSPPAREDCPDVLRLFSRHLEGDVAPEVCAELEAHLERCPSCRGACASLQRMLALCRELPAPQVGEVVRQSVRRARRGSPGQPAAARS